MSGYSWVVPVIPRSHSDVTPFFPEIIQNNPWRKITLGLFDEMPAQPIAYLYWP
jgi:hypothetical protein